MNLQHVPGRRPSGKLLPPAGIVVVDLIDIVSVAVSYPHTPGRAMDRNAEITHRLTRFNCLNENLSTTRYD